MKLPPYLVLYNAEAYEHQLINGEACGVLLELAGLGVVLLGEEPTYSSEVNRPVRLGSLRTGTDGNFAVRPRVGRKWCCLFETGRGRTAMTAN